MEINSYNLSRNFFNWCFDNPEKVSPNHSAIYFFAVEHCNRLGWKEKFGFPTQMAMDAIGIKKHQTYIKYFNDLIDFGFIKLVQKSSNQYSSNIISLINALPQKDKALDKALIKHGAKQTESNGQSTGQSNSSIDKQVNKETSKQVNNLELPFSSDIFKEVWNILLQEKKWKGKSENALKLSLDQLKKYPEPVAIQMIKKSIAGGYQGLFGPEEGIQNNKTATTQTYTPKQNTEFPITPPFKGIPRG